VIAFACGINIVEKTNNRTKNRGGDSLVHISGSFGREIKMLTDKILFNLQLWKNREISFNASKNPPENTYSLPVTGVIVSTIQCPHCQKDIELEDGSFGLFNCPYCDEEFSWDSDSKQLFHNVLKWMNIIGAGIAVIGLIGVIGTLIYFQYDPPSGYDGLIILLPIGIIPIGLSINLLAVIIWYINKIISIEEETPGIQSLTFFGFVVIFIIYCFMIWFF
jgi:hypothetical protein